ncbi:expressed unknown protein [Seminavis robusta]|uniref:G-protein coupled receptors family 2 profile 2 domain-containing protein n=1 Tax=Seminavis robusta TaxID=568900 RepID=A0A9N8H7Q5_9STRA|nr:expressed unknown protein [Seminavis robusta]|eukprot:Sro212_g088080.1 n/a (338) ;mRNA; r:6280-7551
MSTSDAQARALAILPKTTGCISIIGSSIIAFSVLRDKQKLSKSYHRLLLGMSLVDVLVSFWEALSTWPMPTDSEAMFASGNFSTCVMQGFFIQFYVVSSFYSVSLAIYYTVVLRYNWSEDQVKKLEPYLHSIPLLWGFATGIIGISLKLYNPAGLWCWISPFPGGCSGDECIRGINGNTYRWAFFYGPLWANIAFVTIAMALVWVNVRKGASPTNNSDSASMNGSRHSTTKQQKTQLLKNDTGALERDQLAKKIKRDVAFQGFLYSGSFYVTWIWLTAVRFLQLIGEPVPYQLLAAAAFFAPLQGFFNALIYLSPKFMAVKKANPDAGLLRWIRDAI